VAAALNDPHVVPIHNYGEIEGRLYVDMRLIDGHDLGTLIASEGGRLSASRAVAILEQVARALDSAHQAGLVHRDVKPSNILITGGDFAYLIDFGIARANADTAMTSTGHVVGTLAYMAPERFSGTTDPRADVYSLACALHECLTGKRPYPGDSLEQQLAGHLSAPPPRPSTTSPNIPSAFDAVIGRGMAKTPGDRYQTASELADAARAALTIPLDAPTSSLPSQAPTQRVPLPPSISEQRREIAKAKLEQQLVRRIEEARRRPSLLIVGGAVAALAVVAALVLTAINTEPDHNSSNAATTTVYIPPATTAAKTSPETTAIEPPTTTPPVAPLPAFNPSANLGAN